MAFDKSQMSTDLQTLYDGDPETRAAAASGTADAVADNWSSSQESWQTPTFDVASGWANYGSGYNNAGYYKDEFGRVHLRGLIKDGSIGVSHTIFTLPVGYRPPGRELHVTIANTLIARCDVATDGRVIPVNGSNIWFSLDGISFRIA